MNKRPPPSSRATSRGRALGSLIAAAIITVGAVTALTRPSTAETGMLDLTSYEMTFDEPFDKLDVSAWGPGSRWIAHTPWNGDFGDAGFMDPTEKAPFTTKRGILTISMTKNGQKWQSGLLASVDRENHGFAQSGGYFEIRAKLPSGAGVWPSFWLGSAEAGEDPHPEVDVFEYYGHNPSAYMATSHLWKDGKNVYGEAIKIDVPPHNLEDSFHTYGVLITSQSLIFYLDRREVGRLPSRPEFLQPSYVMVDLGAGGGWPTTGLADRSTMLVDYIRAFQLRSRE
jgi:beta-glucanase (GH16 family)